MTTKTRYTAKDISVLEGLDPVRKRPSMYIGGVDQRGLHHLVWEIVDNAVDEYLNGYATALTVSLKASGREISIRDNGRGIPVDLHPRYNRPALELILTTLHSGGKFGEGNYLHSGGLHGVGSSVVNALSSKLTATVRRDGYEWRQTFARGKPVSNLEKIGAARGHGTTISFEADQSIFPSTRFDSTLVRSHLEDMAYVHAGLRIYFEDEAAGVVSDLSQAGGIPAFLSRLIAGSGKAPIGDTAFYFSRADDPKFEVALQWGEATAESVRSYVNGIRTLAGGTHENGLRIAVVKAVRHYMHTHDVKVKGLSITAEDIREGLVAVLSVFSREPMFQGQTKERLNNPEMTSAVENALRPALEAWLNANKSVADQIISRIVLAARARLASREAAGDIKRKSLTAQRLQLPGKLADCKSTDLTDSELFIVEGDSAGGSAKQGRDHKTQAVLPLRGKILNAEGLPLGKVLANAELADLVAAIGTGVGERFDLSRLRYGKIILLMDADADGHHITTLLLAFFFRHMPELIRRGHVYIAQPPLYRLDLGKATYWARDDAHKTEILSRYGKNARPEITRFKGLGEMPPATLAETTLNKRTRTLLRVAVPSELEADDTFVVLLGKDPASRYRFITSADLVAEASALDL